MATQAAEPVRRRLREPLRGMRPPRRIRCLRVRWFPGRRTLRRRLPMGLPGRGHARPVRREHVGRLRRRRMRIGMYCIFVLRFGVSRLHSRIFGVILGIAGRTYGKRRKDHPTFGKGGP